MLYVDTKWWLPDDILIKADRMSMANSLELRVPFLDHTLVEFAASMPGRLKLKGSVTKYIEKRAGEKLLPREIVWREKMGFPTPLDLMFRSELRDYVRDTLLSARFNSRGYFDRRQVEKLVQGHESGHSRNAMVLWQLVVLEEWHRAFIDGGGPPNDTRSTRITREGAIARG
jgi:asparagine synthase (glutamine-hydrolysing)